MRYEWAVGSRIVGLHADDVGRRLTELQRRDGHVTAESVVEDARPVDSPLHPAFEWDDEIAAEEYRKDQARCLIRSVVIRDVTPEQSNPVRAFVMGTAAYTSTVVAMQRQSEREVVLRRARRELEQWRRRYEYLEEFADIIAAIDDSQASKIAA